MELLPRRLCICGVEMQACLTSSEFKKQTRAEEIMAGWIRALAMQAGGPEIESQSLCKKLGTDTYNPGAVPRGFLGFAGCQTCSRFSQGIRQNRVTEQGIPLLPLAVQHLYRQVHISTCIYMYTQKQTRNTPTEQTTTDNFPIKISQLFQRC